MGRFRARQTSKEKREAEAEQASAVKSELLHLECDKQLFLLCLRFLLYDEVEDLEVRGVRP
jgi:hypothetical protein